MATERCAHFNRAAVSSEITCGSFKVPLGVWGERQSAKASARATRCQRALMQPGERVFLLQDRDSLPTPNPKQSPGGSLSPKAVVSAAFSQGWLGEGGQWVAGAAGGASFRHACGWVVC